MQGIDLESAHAIAPPALYAAALQYAPVPDAEIETPFLPRDHPPWMRDAVAVSARARQWIEKLKPIAIRVLTFWDHAVRSITVMGRELHVDPSGSYKL